MVEGAAMVTSISFATTIALFMIVIFPNVGTQFNLLFATFLLISLGGFYCLGYLLWRSLIIQRDNYKASRDSRIDADLSVDDIRRAENSFNNNRYLFIAVSAVMGLFTSYYIIGINVLLYFTFVFIVVFFLWQGLGYLNWRLIK